MSVHIDPRNELHALSVSTSVALLALVDVPVEQLRAVDAQRLAELGRGVAVIATGLRVLLQPHALGATAVPR